METATTARRETTAPLGTLYVGLELSAKEWRLACSGGLATRGMQVVIRPGDRVGWQRAIARAKRRYGLAASAAVWSYCEAGRDGAWPHRWLTREACTIG